MYDNTTTGSLKCDRCGVHRGAFTTGVVCKTCLEEIAELDKSEADFKAYRRALKCFGKPLDLLAYVLNRFQKDIYETAQDKGWREKEIETGTAIALMYSELSEALEADRKGNPPDDKIPEFTGLEAELADAIIRIFDFAQARRLNVIGAMLAKAEYNKTRSHRHGGKRY